MNGLLYNFHQKNYVVFLISNRDHNPSTFFPMMNVEILMLNPSQQYSPSFPVPEKRKHCWIAKKNILALNTKVLKTQGLIMIFAGKYTWDLLNIFDRLCNPPSCNLSRKNFLISLLGLGGG